ncbi:MAG: SDR family oxidoreductase [Magnetovibrio sp.]|nr:SDR family oxidoreductase [Magnetovibrio sp.]
MAAARGYDVCVNYHANKVAAQAVAADVEACGQRSIIVQADLSVEQDIVRLFETAERQLGPLTALVNNAGILEEHSRLQDMSWDRWQRIFQTNVFGVFAASREAVKRMSTKQGGAGGSIVNLSSIASRLGAAGEYVDYAASKAAVDTMSTGLAKEVASEGIRVNAVRPGIVLTEIHASGGEAERPARIAPTIPMQRAGEPDEVAKTILWLLSDEASYITGSIIDVSGGR